jgi:hypothetical protein
MKAILEFNLPEDKEDFDFAVRGLDWSIVCWNMDQWLRVQIKHAPDEMSDDTYKAFEQCREQLREFISDYNLNLEG